MTDKQIIIEDCPYFVNGVCMEYLDGACENHKCDLKIIRELEQKLKAKEQECEMLKEKLIKWLGKEGLRQSDKEFYEQQLDQFKAENDKLKVRNIKYMNGNISYQLKNSLYKQTLTEIKEIVSSTLDCGFLSNGKYYYRLLQLHLYY